MDDGDSVGGNTGNGLLRKDSVGDNGSALEGEVALVAAMSISSLTGVPSCCPLPYPLPLLLLLLLQVSLSAMRGSCGGDLGKEGGSSNCSKSLRYFWLSWALCRGRPGLLCDMGEVTVEEVEGDEGAEEEEDWAGLEETFPIGRRPKSEESKGAKDYGQRVVAERGGDLSFFSVGRRTHMDEGLNGGMRSEC